MKHTMHWMLVLFLAAGMAACSSPTDSAPNPNEDDDDTDTDPGPGEGEAMIFGLGSDPIVV